MKTAEELEITYEEYEALKQVKCLLDTGTIPEENFNMKFFFDGEQDCGTVCCIGGWMQVLMGLGNVKTRQKSLLQHPLTDVQFYLRAKLKCGEDSSALDPLFYPIVKDIAWDQISKTQAIQAIDNFLETGDPKWPEICKDMEKK